MKCPLCHERKGKRLCKVNAGQLICPLCCASIRTAVCEGCSHYAPSLAYQRAKALTNQRCTVEVLPDVDDRCDDALALAENGDLSQAEAALEDLRRQHPEYHTVLYATGLCHALCGRLDETIALLERAVEIFPPFAYAHYNLGTAYTKKIKIEKAVRAYEAAIAVDGRDGPVGSLAVRQIDELEAIVMRSNGVSLSTYIDNMRTFDQAFAALREQRYRVAIDLFAQVLKTDRNHVPTHGNLGLAYAGLGNRQKALECLDKAIAIDPEYEPALVNRWVVESLAEGEALPYGGAREVSYYSEFRNQNRSYRQQLIDDSVAADKALPGARNGAKP